jgi:hypothetical protein
MDDLLLINLEFDKYGICRMSFMMSFIESR